MTMKKIALLLGLLLATPAFAVDNTVIVTPGVGVTMKSKDIGAGVQAMQPILSDSSGNALLTTLGADAVSNTLTGIPVYSRQLFYNGTTWDRWQGAVTLTSGTLTTVSTVTNLSQMGGQAIAMGTGVRSAGTQRVTIATDDVLPLPTGASTSANQTTINTSIGTTNTNLGAPASTVCGTATGTCDLTALIKFLNTSASTPLNNSSVAINVSTATTTQLVALSGTTLIYVTSFDVIAGGTGNITFVYGTGASCGTGTTSLTGAYNLTAQAGISKGAGIGTVLRVPAGNALCVTTSAAVQMSGSVSYQQF